MRVLDLNIRELGVLALPAKIYRARLTVTVFRDKAFADVLIWIGLIIIGIPTETLRYPHPAR